MSRDDAWCVIVSLVTSLDNEGVKMHYSLFLYSSQITKRFREWTGLVGLSSALQGHADCRGTDILQLVRATDVCTTDTKTENVCICSSV